MNKDELLLRLKENEGNGRVYGGLTPDQVEKTIQSAYDLNSEDKIELEDAVKEGIDGVYIKAKVLVLDD
jgi:hypothetical protein